MKKITKQPIFVNGSKQQGKCDSYCFMVGDETIMHLDIIDEELRDLAEERLEGIVPFNFHAKIVDLQLGLGVQNTLEQAVLNNMELNEDVKLMVMFGHMAETLRRKVRGDIEKISKV